MSIPFPFQLQVNLQNDIQQPDSGIDTSSLDNAADDDIDAALSELQLTLGGSNGHTKANDITHIPELTDYLRFLRYIVTANQLGTMGATLMFSPLIFRPKKFTLKGYKRYWFAYKDLYLYLYKTKDHFRSNQTPTIVINLRGCEVTPEVTLAQGKFNIKLEVPPEDGYGANQEMWIRCDNVSFCIHLKLNQCFCAFML